ncbi:Oidioi.mRNA.OKI2018_I69.PAR.g12185.t1.cds [Oikopleura dioica]|uniref:Oidioi.mRNA.OKI2018_I69.PAR.g12185.t1.cds n=1 Tax=Oikopleura dioica TaxID=34765 RepID=A0ABN7RZI1_OIKDI|nr:Oidioi.mRNA.OKI2018_I69.PAR.g12185.t1.cds [Oikopleura dioica]
MDSPGCFNDYVEIIDGDLSLGRFCGENPALVPILSSSNRLVFKFVSDEKNEARGFALTYKFLWGVPNVIKCDFEGQDLCRGWIQDHFDELDWKMRSGPTSSPNTGPQEGVDNSSYAYMEASAPATYGDSAQLISAFMFMVPGELYCLRFHYHMFGREIGTLQVYATERGFNVGKRLIWSRTGNQGDQWKIATVPITVVMPNYNQVLFKAIRGGSYEGDIGLDNVHVRKGRCEIGENVSFWEEEEEISADALSESIQTESEDDKDQNSEQEADDNK